jgi:hypothetical protein
MYSVGQTLVHKKEGFLARLATRDDGPWAWDIGKNTAMVLENGTKVAYDINEFTHISDEFGMPYAESPEKGQFVDISAKKYLVSKAKLAKMRKEKNLLFWKNGIEFAALLIKYLFNPPKIKSENIKVSGGSYIRESKEFTVGEGDCAFSLHISNFSKGDIHCRVPDNFRSRFGWMLIGFLRSEGWKVNAAISRHKPKNLYMFMAEKNGKGLMWDCHSDTTIVRAIIDSK